MTRWLSWLVGGAPLAPPRATTTSAVYTGTSSCVPWQQTVKLTRILWQSPLGNRYVEGRRENCHTEPWPAGRYSAVFDVCLHRTERFLSLFESGWWSLNLLCAGSSAGVLVSCGPNIFWSNLTSTFRAWLFWSSPTLLYHDDLFWCTMPHFSSTLMHCTKPWMSSGPDPLVEP